MTDPRSQSLSRPRSVVAAWLMVALVLLSLAYGAGSGFPAWPAGLAAWGAGVALWPRLDPKQQRFALVLCALGGIALVAAVVRGNSPAWAGLLTQNTPLLGMLAAVSFLQLVGIAGDEEARPLPRGARALWQTVAGVHVVGAVINISSVFIVVVRSRGRGDDACGRRSSVARGFLSAALWCRSSPRWRSR